MIEARAASVSRRERRCGTKVNLQTFALLQGPDASVLNELERVTEVGGEIVLISPEQPEWFEGHGWRRRSFDPLPAPPHDDWIDSFFGRPDPPHELVSRRVTRATAD
jgi:hypothetical protein